LELGYCIKLPLTFLFSGHVLVSGDYSQLELRILSHFSEDENLLRIFHSKGDVFELLASKWKQKPVHMVSILFVYIDVYRYILFVVYRIDSRMWMPGAW